MGAGYDKNQQIVSRAVVVGLIRGGDVLMLQRVNEAIWEAGSWQQPGGMVEGGEAIYEAAIREVREEVGVKVQSTDLKFLGVARYRESTGRDVSVYFFASEKWLGDPKNMELDKHMAIDWFPTNNMPVSTPEHAKLMFGDMSKVHFIEMLDGRIVYRADDWGSK